MLKTNGYILGRNVNRRKWRNAFENFYSKELLELLSSVPREAKNGWFDSIFRQGNSSIHPLRHILVIILLSGSLQEFFSGNIEEKKDLKTPPPFIKAKKGLKTPPPFIEAKKGLKTQISKERINWQKRDEQLLDEVKTIVENWNLFEHHRPKRMTRSSISNKLKSPTVVKAMRGSIPLTQKYIDSISETIEEYHLRKLKWAVKEMCAYNDPLTQTKLLNKAGIRRTGILPSHKRFLNEVIIDI